MVAEIWASVISSFVDWSPNFGVFCHAICSIGGCVACVNLSFSPHVIVDITIMFLNWT